MSKSKHIALALVVSGFALSTVSNAGSVGGFGGSTEFTQLANNAELIKVGVDTSQTSITTVNQYMMQIEQYRNQLINTIGIDPMRSTQELARLDDSYQRLSNYRNTLIRTQGSLNTQLDAWDQRYTAAKVGNRTLSQQLQVEAQLRDQRNAAAIERARRDEEIMQEVNSDIAALRQAESEIPKSQGVNESIQNMHRTMNKIAYQNTRMIELLVASRTTANQTNIDQNVTATDQARRAEERRQYEAALRKRQQEFIGDGYNR
jgi:hypothetical protein